MKKKIEELNFVANDFDGTIHGSLTNILFNIKYKLNEIIDVLNSKDDCVEKPEETVKEITRLFLPEISEESWNFTHRNDKIKSFIHTLLQSREDEIYKELEEWARERHSLPLHISGYKRALEDLLSHLSTKRKQ